MRKVFTLILVTAAAGVFAQVKWQNAAPSKDFGDIHAKTEQTYGVGTLASGYTNESDAEAGLKTEQTYGVGTLACGYTKESGAEAPDVQDWAIALGASKLSGSDFNLYPTNATDIVHIDANVPGLITIFVFDAHGIRMKADRFEGHYDLDVSNYEKGLYFVRLGRNGLYVSQKFIKQ